MINIYALLVDCKIFFIDFYRENKGEGEKVRKVTVRASHRSASSCTPPPGTKPTTPVRALARDGV